MCIAFNATSRPTVKPSSISNLAPRLSALGYTQVNWYGGGREGWEVNELPETDLTLQEW